ncbi:hypothetical protein P3S67_029575 [Capsicum chacoense]
MHITSVCTYPKISRVYFSLYNKILYNSRVSSYSIISNNVAAQLVLLHFPFDPSSAGGLMFNTVALVLDNSLQLIISSIAPISVNEFREHPMVLVVGQFDTISQPYVNILTPMIVSELENRNTKPTKKIYVEASNELTLARLGVVLRMSRNVQQLQLQQLNLQWNMGTQNL